MNKTDLEKTQHYTTYQHMLCDNLIRYIPENAYLVEPFVGQGDLLHLFPNHNWEIYDLEPHVPNCIKQDTLLEPPIYNNKFVITNPPYLAKNKAVNRAIYEKYNLDDLYKIAIDTIMDCEGGILIIPTNFFCDNISKEIRIKFLDRFDIKHINIFTEPVFESTTYSICSFAFIKKQNDRTTQTVPITKYPANHNFKIVLDKQYGYRIGGELFELVNDIKPIFSRLLLNKEPEGYITNISLTTIDTRTEPFHLSFGEPVYRGKSTDRTYASLVCEYELDEEIQIYLVNTVNKFLCETRQRYGNLLFTNYRDYDRKRVEFDFIYKLLTYFYFKDL